MVTKRFFSSSHQYLNIRGVWAYRGTAEQNDWKQFFFQCYLIHTIKITTNDAGAEEGFPQEQRPSAPWAPTHQRTYYEQGCFARQDNCKSLKLWGFGQMRPAQSCTGYHGPRQRNAKFSLSKGSIQGGNYGVHTRYSPMSCKGPQTKNSAFVTVTLTQWQLWVCNCDSLRLICEGIHVGWVSGTRVPGYLERTRKPRVPE